MAYEIIDNLLSDQEFDRIKNVMLGSEFPWFLNKEKVGPGSKAKFEDGTDAEIFNYQFIHMFYKDLAPSSEYINEVTPILNKLDLSALIRIKANMTMATPKKIIFGHHVDQPNSPENLKTAVFYLNTTNGPTLFEDGLEVECIENRLVVFDTNMLHSAISHTDAKTRCVINFNFYKK